MALAWLWWRAWFPFGAVIAAALCVEIVALGDTDLHFAWQAWHLVTLTFTLRGRRSTHGTGLALVALCSRLAPSSSFTHNFVTHHPSHNFVTRNVCHTIFYTTTLSHNLSHTISHTHLGHTQLFHTPSFPQLCHTHTHTQLCHAPFFTQASVSHTTLHIQLLNGSILHHLLCLSFLPCST